MTKKAPLTSFFKHDLTFSDNKLMKNIYDVYLAVSLKLEKYDFDAYFRLG